MIEDYGHHPVELGVTLAAAKGAYPDRRIVVAFQPHRYTRTRDCFEDFVQVLKGADAVWLTEVYAAGEKPIAGADGRSLTRALRLSGQQEVSFAKSIEDLSNHIIQNALGGDIVLCMGAGSIGTVPANVMQRAKKSDLLVELKKIKDKSKKKEIEKDKDKNKAKSKTATKKRESSKLTLVGREKSVLVLKPLGTQRLNKTLKTGKAHRSSKGRKGVGS